MAQVIYARVPDTLKDDADEYAEKQGVTLTSAVVDLIQRGLAAAATEKSIAALESKLARTSADKAHTEASLTVAVNELQALRAFAQRATQTKVAECPNVGCRKEVTGFDLLGTGRCGECGESLLDLLAPRTSLLDQREFGLLVGALGAAVVGAVIFGSKDR